MDITTYRLNQHKGSVSDKFKSYLCNPIYITIYLYSYQNKTKILGSPLRKKYNLAFFQLQLQRYVTCHLPLTPLCHMSCVSYSTTTSRHVSPVSYSTTMSRHVSPVSYSTTTSRHLSRVSYSTTTSAQSITAWPEWLLNLWSKNWPSCIWVFSQWILLWWTDTQNKLIWLVEITDRNQFLENNIKMS